MPNQNVQWDRGSPRGNTTHHFKHRRKPHTVEVQIKRIVPVYIANKYNTGQHSNYTQAAITHLNTTNGSQIL